MSKRPSWATLIVTAAFTAGAAAQGVIFRGLLHVPLGDATISVNALDQLVVDQLGSGGGDGVSILLGQADGFDLTQVAPPGGLPVGANELFRARGSVAGTPGLEVAELVMTRISSGLRFNATFDAFGAMPKTVEVYLFGTLVGSATNVSISQVASTPDVFPTELRVRRRISPQNRPALVTAWPGPIPITLPGGGVVTGNELRVVVMTPTETLDFIAEVDGEGSDVPELYLEEESLDPTCEGDLDGDGDVDITDLSELLGNFGQTENVTLMDGDLDTDGDVDIADISALLALYGQTCP